MKIKVLYEDENILAIDKPSGVAVHHAHTHKKNPAASEELDTVTDWVLEHYPMMKNVGETQAGVSRPGVVHRLDRETSGVLLLAKNQKTHQALKKQFTNREIKKTYLAIVCGSVKNDAGVIDKPIGRSPSDFRRRLAGRGARGGLREAITEYKVLQRFSAKGGSASGGEDNKFSLLEISPKTGRTHQIRVHMKYLNHPVVCDPLYNPGKPGPEGISRMALHAKSIEFENIGGKTIKIESPTPGEFERFGTL